METKKRKSGTIKLIVGILVSAVFLYLAARGLNYKEVGIALKSADYWWLVPAVGLYFVGLFVRAWRWQLLLRHLEFVPIRKVFPVMAIGYLGNNILPARAGEVLRASALKQVCGIPATAGLATIVLERIFDALVMLIFLLSTVTLFDAFSQDLPLSVGLVVFCFAVLASFGVISSKPAFLVKIYERTFGAYLPERMREPVKGLTSKFLLGLESVRSFPMALFILLISLASWIIESTAYLMVSHAFAGLHLGLRHMIVTVAVVNLVMSLPSSPGFVGTFHASCKWALVKFGVAPVMAASFAVIAHMLIWLPATVVGWVCTVLHTRRYAFIDPDLAEDATEEPAPSSA